MWGSTDEDGTSVQTTEATSVHPIMCPVTPLKGEIGSAMCPRVSRGTVILSVAVSGLLAIVAPEKAEAIPVFSRQTGKPCSTCHSVVPKLNQTGQNFRMNGFRFPEDTEREALQDLKHVPRSAEIEVKTECKNEAGYTQDSSERVGRWHGGAAGSGSSEADR